MLSFFNPKKGVLVLALCVGFLSLGAIAQDAEDFASEIAGKKEQHSQQVTGVADQHVRLGKEYFSVGEYQRAMAEFNRALDIVPDHSEANEYKLQAIEAIAGGGQSTSILPMATEITNQERWGAQRAYQQGVESFRSGKRDVAMEKFNTAMDLDPTYSPAKRFVTRLLDLEKEQLDRDHDILVSESMNQVRRAWLPGGKANKITGPEGIDGSAMTDAKINMMRKVEQIIPEINFTQAHLRDVLQYLSKITGVNIILDERVFEGSFTPVYTGGSELDDEEGEEAVSAAGPVSDTVTISLTNIPLLEALKYILKIKGLKYRIDDYAIMVSTPEAIGDEEMQTRFYQLSAGMGEFVDFTAQDDMADSGGLLGDSEFGSDMDGGSKGTIRDVLMNSGVPFPPGSSVFLDKRSGTLIVHNTPENLTMVEQLLKIIDKSPFQVSIESKYIQIGQNDLEELGFNWFLDSPARVGSREIDPATGLKGNKYQISDGATTSVLEEGGRIVEGVGLLEPFTDDVRDDRKLDSPAFIGATKGQENVGTLTRRQTNPVTGELEEYDVTLWGQRVNNVVKPNNAVLGTVNTVVANLPPINPALPGILPNSGLVALQGILSEPQFTMVIHALDKSGNANLLSSPKVTTVNNQQAQIELVEEIIYPGEYDVQPPVLSDNGFSPAVVIPGDFITRDVGIILNVTPSVGSDRKTITLTLIPEISELDRFIDWGNGTSGIISQPVFKTTNVSTTVIVNDGETVVLGGLMEEQSVMVHDKYPILGDIPFLGRFFRHDLEQSEKKNIMIFVTARLIDADGEDLHPSR